MKDLPSKHRKVHAEEWGAAVNRFTEEFIRDFCHENGRIDWEKLVRFVSESEPLNKKPRSSSKANRS